MLSVVDNATQWLPVSHVHFHTKHNESVEVKLRSGFILRTTDDHGMLVCDDSLTLRQVSPLEVTGKPVPVARRIPIPVLRREMDTPDGHTPLSRNFGYVIGHYLGDGGAYDSDKAVRLMSDHEAHLAAVKVAARECLSAPMNDIVTGGKLKGFKIASDQWWAWFREHLGVLSHDKRLPAWCMAGPEEFRWGIVDGLLSTDGHVAVSKRDATTCCICSDNRDLLDDLSVLLRSLGVMTSIAVTGVTHWRLHMDLDDVGELSLTHPERHDKLRRAVALYADKARQYTKVMPWNKALRDAWVTALPGGFAELRDRYPILSSTYVQKGYVSLLMARRFVDEVGLPGDVPLLTRWVSMINDSDLLFVVVDSVDVIAREEVTFDVTVPGPHVTVCPVSGLVTHQTMSVHVPVGDKTVTDVRERMMASKMLWSIKDRGKTMGNVKHEQILGLGMGKDPGGDNHRFSSADDAMAAIERGEVDLNDNVEIGQH